MRSNYKYYIIEFIKKGLIILLSICLLNWIYIISGLTIDYFFLGYKKIYTKNELHHKLMTSDTTKIKNLTILSNYYRDSIFDFTFNEEFRILLIKYNSEDKKDLLNTLFMTNNIEFKSNTSYYEYPLANDRNSYLKLRIRQKSFSSLYFEKDIKLTKKIYNKDLLYVSGIFRKVGFSEDKDKGKCDFIFSNFDNNITSFILFKSQEKFNLMIIHHLAESNSEPESFYILNQLKYVY